MLKLKKLDKFFMAWQAISELRGVTEVCCHTILLAARHKRTHPALTPAGEGWYSIYLPRRLSWPRCLITLGPRPTPYLPNLVHTFCFHHTPVKMPSCQKITGWQKGQVWLSTPRAPRHVFWFYLALQFLGIMPLIQLSLFTWLGIRLLQPESWVFHYFESCCHMNMAALMQGVVRCVIMPPGMNEVWRSGISVNCRHSNISAAVVT